jgi:hypothetical protein
MHILTGARRILWMLPLLFVASRVAAGDLICYRVESPVTVDGYSADWASMDGYNLPGERGTLRIAHDQVYWYMLLRIPQSETAYLISRQGYKPMGQCARGAERAPWRSIRGLKGTRG